MNRYGEHCKTRQQIMTHTAWRSAACCVGIPISFVLAMALILVFGFGRYWYFALAVTFILTIVFVQSNRGFKARGGNAETIKPYILPTAIASVGEVLEILGKSAPLYETDNNCTYCFLQEQRPVRIMALPVSDFEQDGFRAVCQEGICQILEGAHVPAAVRADRGHSELRIHLILAEENSPALENCLEENAYHTMAVRQGAMTAAFLFSEQKLLVSAFFGDHYGDAKKYTCGCRLLAELFASDEAPV